MEGVGVAVERSCGGAAGVAVAVERSCGGAAALCAPRAGYVGPHGLGGRASVEVKFDATFGHVVQAGALVSRESRYVAVVKSGLVFPAWCLSEVV